MPVNYQIDEANKIVKLEAPIDKASVIFDPKSETLIVICSAANETTSLGILEQAKFTVHDYQEYKALKRQQEEAARKRLLQK